MAHEFFKDLNSSELEQAIAWFDRLRNTEKEDVRKTLGVLNEEATLKLVVDSSKGEEEVPYAVIVAGSSIDGDSYMDIDMFVLSERTLYNDDHHRGKPNTKFACQFHGKDMPATISYSAGEEAHDREDIEDYTNVHGKDPKYGAPITLALFYELYGMDAPREGHDDDLIEPRERSSDQSHWIGKVAEEIIEFNRQRGTKFLVLSRTY